MTTLVDWAFAWVMIHWLISGGPLRDEIVVMTGERRFRIVFSLLSVVCLGGLCTTYAMVKPVDQPLTPIAIGAFAVAQLLSSVLLVGGLSTRNPTAASMEDAVTDPDVVRGIIRVTRHPFLWGVLLWSISYLAIRHDASAIVFAGAIGLVAARGIWSIDRKRRRAIWDTDRTRRSILQKQWSAFNHATSSLPLSAVLEGRQQLVLSEIGFKRLSVALVAWLAMLWLQLGL